MQTSRANPAMSMSRRNRLKYACLTLGLATAFACNPAAAEEGAAKDADQKDDVVTLAPLKVEADTQNEGPLGPVIQQDSSMATKTDTPIVDTARSISVETRQQIQDKGFQRLEDAYMYTAGVHGGTAGFDSRGDWGSLRGFDMPVAYVDGLQYGNTGYYNFSLPAIEMLESVEILKGPASALYGMSSVGGIVNAVSKRPQEETMRRVAVEYGTFDRKQATIDMTGKLDESGKILGRVVALVRDAETQVDYSKNDAVLFAPSITLRPDADTDVTILARYQKTDNTPDIQFLAQAGTLDPAPNGQKLSTGTFIGEPDLNRMDSIDQSVTLDAKRRIDDVWSLRGILRYSHSASHLDQAYWSYYGTQPDRYEPSGEIYRDFYKQNGATYMWVGDLNATAKFTTGPVDHQVLMGASYSNVKFDNDYNQCVPGDPSGCYIVGTIDPFNPTFTGVPAFDVVDNPTNTFKQTGVYVQDQATLLERIVLTGGLRWDKFDATDPYGGGSNDDHDVTYNASLLYKFDAGFSPYASYAESFLQESYGSTVSGETFKPTHGKQYEVGLKYQPPGTASLFTLALFDIAKSNILTEDPMNPGFSIQGGEAKSRGVELEAQTVVRDFYFEGNYTYLDTENEFGAPIDYTARHQASGWVTWRPQGELQGFKLGGGIRYIGRSIYGGTYAPSNTLGDAMIGYETADWDLALNARNVTDRIYVATAGYGSGFYGQRRTVVLALSRNF
jgi:iron complex outermembrane receptor protein